MLRFLFVSILSVLLVAPATGQGLKKEPGPADSTDSLTQNFHVTADSLSGGLTRREKGFLMAVEADCRKVAFYTEQNRTRYRCSPEAMRVLRTVAKALTDG